MGLENVRLRVLLGDLKTACICFTGIKLASVNLAGINSATDAVKIARL